MKTRSSTRSKTEVSGVNVQWPWSQAIIDGRKTVETRNYPLPKKYLGVPLALIETAGRDGAKSGVSIARIIGLIKFSKCFQYQSKSHWMGDKRRHLVSEADPDFHWRKGQAKWGWEVTSIEKFEPPKPAPKRKGILFTSKCPL